MGVNEKIILLLGPKASGTSESQTEDTGREGSASLEEKG